MLKLIKMDFYRLFTSKAIKIGALFACVISAAYMLLILGIIEITKLSFAGDTEAMVQSAIMVPQLAWVGGVDFGDIILSAIEAFSLFVGCIITANFIGTEQSSRYTKNFAGQLPNRGYMAISKFVVTSVAQIIIVVCYAVVASALALPLYGQYINAYNFGGLAAALALRILLYIAINAIILLICIVTRSHAGAMVVGCIFGIGVTKIVYPIVTSLLSSAHINFDIGSYMPDGVNGQISITGVGDIWVRAVIVGLAFIVVLVSAAYFILKKRDVK